MRRKQTVIQDLRRIFWEIGPSDYTGTFNKNVKIHLIFKTLKIISKSKPKTKPKPKAKPETKPKPKPETKPKPKPETKPKPKPETKPKPKLKLKRKFSGVDRQWAMSP